MFLIHLLHSDLSVIFINERTPTIYDLTSYPQKNQEFWYTVIQGLVGKLYLLSLFYIMYVSFASWLSNDLLMSDQ